MGNETCFIIKRSLIVNLFRHEGGEDPLIQYLNRDWLATVLYCKKTIIDLNEVIELQLLKMNKLIA